MTLKFSAFDVGGAIADTDLVVGYRTPGVTNLQWVWSKVKAYLGIGSLASSTIVGTTTGSAVCVQPHVGTNYKLAKVRFVAYENTTGSAQKYTFDTAFANVPIFLANTVPECTVDATGITFPASMSGVMSGYAIVVGE